MEKIKRHQRVIHQNNIVSSPRQITAEGAGQKEEKEKKNLTPQEKEPEFAIEKAYGFTANSMTTN